MPDTGHLTPNGVAITCLASSQKILIFWGGPGQVDRLLEGAQAA